LRLFDLQREHIKLLLYVYAYSGMRREELYNSTIEEENGIWYFKITKGKNNYSIRKVPLHDNLIALGLNNDLLSNATKRISYQKIGRIFNETIRPQVTSSGKQTLHSWRHTFATKLQEQNVSDNIIRNLIGHSAKDTLNRVYARKAINMQLLKDAINLLDFG
jgi:integrase